MSIGQPKSFFPEPARQPRPRKPADAYRFLVEKQTLVALASGAELVGSASDGRGEKRYHATIGGNVHGWDALALADFTRGQGNEADNKIRACHSSSALACSLFNTFRADPSPVLKALGLPPSPTPTLTLERILRVLPDGGFGGCPNYDCAIEYGVSGLIAGVEVKYSEWASPRPHPPLKPKYVLCPSIWDGLPRLKELAREVTESDPHVYLDSPQLVRHLLGLHLTGRPYRLYYLWVDTHHAEASAHRQEVADFRSRLDDPSAFTPVTVQDLILSVAKDDPARCKGWVDFMTRYL